MSPRLMSPRSLTACAIAFSLISAAAWAGPKEDLQLLSRKFLTLHSYHVSMQSSDGRMPKIETDFVAPNRYRMQMPIGTQYVIGDVMYMSINGRTMRMPMPKGATSHWRESDRAFREIDQAQVELLGNDTVNGKSAKKYRITTAGKTPSTSLFWAGLDGYPIKTEATSAVNKRNITMTILYSRFNDASIRIDPPK